MINPIDNEKSQWTLGDLLIQLGYKSFESQVAFLRLLILSNITDEEAIKAMTTDGTNKGKQAWLHRHREGYQTYRSKIPFFMPMHLKGDMDGYLAKDESFKPLLSIPLEAPAEAMAWLVHATQLRCLRGSFHAEGPKSDTLMRWSEKSRACNTGEDVQALVWEEKVLRPLGLIGGNSWPAISIETPTALLLHGGLEATVKRRIGYLVHCMQYQQQEKLIRLPVLYPSNPRGLFLHEPSTVTLLADWFLSAYGEARLGTYEEICTQIQAVFNDDDYKKTQWFNPASLDRLKARLLKILDLSADGWPKGGYVRQVSETAALKSQWQAFERVGHRHLVDWPSAFDMVALHLAGLTQRYPALADCFELIHLPLYVESATGTHALANTEDSLLMAYHWCQRRGIQQVIAVSDNEGHQHRYQQAQTEALLEGWGLPTATVSPSAINWQLATALDNVAKTLYVQGVYGLWAQADALKELSEQHSETRHHVYDSEKGEMLSWPPFIERCEGLPYTPPINPLTKDSPYHPFPCPHNQPALGCILQGYWQAYDDEAKRQAWLSSWYDENVSDYLLLGYQGGEDYPLPSLTNLDLCLDAVSEREQVFLKLAEFLKRPIWYWGDTEPLCVYGREEEGEPYLVSYSAQSNQWIHYVTYRAIPSFIGITLHQQTELFIPCLPQAKKENIISSLSFPELDEIEIVLKETEALEDNEAKINGYGRVIRLANQREVQDRALGGEVDKRNRHLQVQGMLGLGQCYEASVTDKALTPQTARQCVWALGLYQTALAIIEKSLEEAKVSSFSKETTAFKFTEAEQTDCKSLKSTLYKKIIDLLNSLSDENTLTLPIYIEQSKAYKVVLTTLRSEVKEELKVIEKRYDFPIPHPNQGDISQGWQHYCIGNPSYVDSIDTLYQIIDTRLIAFTADLWEKVLALTGAAPCESCLLGLGSLVRQEATPYSDIECVLLIEKDTPANRLYFRKAVVVFHGLTLSLSETILPSLSIPALKCSDDKTSKDFYDNGYYIKRGYSLDGLMGHASKIPLGRLSLPKIPWGLELIQTPSALAYHVTPVSDRLEGHHLAAMLSNTVFISGNKDLQAEFNEAVQAHLANQSKQTSVSTTTQKKRALNELSEDIKTYNPEIGKNDEGKQLHVKKDLYRLPTLLIQGLTRLLGGREQGSHQELVYLFQQGLLDEKAHKIVSVWLSLTKTVRLQMYVGSESQQDSLAFTREQEGDEKKDDLLRIIQKEVKTNLIPTGLIFCWYQIALPIYGKVKARFLLEDLTNLVKLSLQDLEKIKSFSFIPKEDACFAFDETNCIHISRRLQQLDIAKAWLKYWLKKLENSSVIEHEAFKQKKRIQKPQAITKEKIPAYCQAYIEQARLAELSKDKHTKRIALSGIQKALKWVKQLKFIEIEMVLLGLQFSLQDGLGESHNACQTIHTLLTLQEKHYGVGHIAMADTLGNLGAVFESQGCYQEARSYYEQTLTLQEGYYGVGHIETASTFHRLGNINYLEGHYQKARNYYELTLTLKEIYYGTSHIEMVDTLHQLGNVCASEGHYKEARSYYERILTLTECYYGGGHIKTANTLGSLGNVNYLEGRYNEARSYYGRTLMLLEEYYGVGHIATVSTLNNLGNVYKSEGRYKEARDYYKLTLTLKEGHYGMGHIETAGTLNNLGTVYSLEGCYKEARSCYEQTLKFKENHYGVDHIETAETLGSLGNVNYSEGRYEEARGHYERTLTLLEAHYGVGHIATAVTLMGLGNVNYSQGRYQEARSYYNRTLKLQEGYYGAGHIETADTLSNLGTFCLSEGRYQEARSYYERTLTLLEDHYGVGHIATAGILMGLGNVCSSGRRHEEARRYYERALKLKESHYGASHIEMAGTLMGLGIACSSEGHYQKARDYYKRALKLQEGYYGADHIETATTFYNLGNINFSEGRYEEARSYYKRALKLQENYYGADHIETAATLNNLGAVFKSEGRYEEARDHFANALRLFEKNYGQIHPDTKKCHSLLNIIKEKLAFLNLVGAEESLYSNPSLELLKTKEPKDFLEEEVTLTNTQSFFVSNKKKSSKNAIKRVQTALTEGNQFIAQQNYKEAKRCYERGLLYLDNMVSSELITQLKAQLEQNLADIQPYLASAKQSLGQL